MPLNLKLPITMDAIAPSTATSTRLFRRVFRISPGQVMILIAIASVFLLMRPIVAQGTASARTEHATVVDGGQPDAARMELHVSTPSSSAPANGRAANPPGSATGTIGGTVLDVEGALIPGATIVLNAASSDDRREATANDNAGFEFDSVKPGIPYEVTVQVTGFSTWTSAAIVLAPSQFVILNDIHLKMEAEATSVTVYGSRDDIAVEQVHLAEQQRVLGIIPNFYAVYDSENTVPLTPRLKFKLAMRVSRDPVTLMGVGFMAGINQAAKRLDYVQGAKGYGQRLGAEAATGFSDILLGGAVLPSLLHQDPRYFYQGTGSTRSRLGHAMSSPFICLGDNSHRQINFSSLGGDLGSSALAMTYYPDSNRGTGEVFTAFGISTAERVISAIAQEFIIPRFTPSLKRSRH
jgi:Carboxypeptidase regulatory-like domain